jgi:hypothetical protein
MMFFSVAALMRLPLSSEIVDFHVAASEESGFLARQTRAGMTEKGTHSLSLSFSRAWLPRVKNPDLFSVILRQPARKSTASKKGEALKLGSTFSAMCSTARP